MRFVVRDQYGFRWLSPPLPQRFIINFLKKTQVLPHLFPLKHRTPRLVVGPYPLFFVAPIGLTLMRLTACTFHTLIWPPPFHSLGNSLDASSPPRASLYTPYFNRRPVLINEPQSSQLGKETISGWLFLRVFLVFVIFLPEFGIQLNLLFMIDFPSHLLCANSRFCWHRLLSRFSICLFSTLARIVPFSGKVVQKTFALVVNEPRSFFPLTRLFLDRIVPYREKGLLTSLEGVKPTNSSISLSLRFHECRLSCRLF